MIFYVMTADQRYAPNDYVWKIPDKFDGESSKNI